MSEKTTITNHIETCRTLFNLAEDYAYGGFSIESNTAWAQAAEIAAVLIRDHSELLFSEEEYSFLKSIINHIVEED